MVLHVVVLQNRPFKQVTFCQHGRQPEVSGALKSSRYRWRIIVSVVLVANQKRQSSLTAILDLKQELLTPTFAIYNDWTSGWRPCHRLDSEQMSHSAKFVSVIFEPLAPLQQVLFTPYPRHRSKCSVHATTNLFGTNIQ